MNRTDALIDLCHATANATIEALEAGESVEEIVDSFVFPWAMETDEDREIVWNEINGIAQAWRSWRRAVAV